MISGYLDDQPKLADDSTEINEWVKRWSLQTGYDLCPLFYEFWKWPADDACSATGPLANLPKYFPDDALTQKKEAATLTASVLEAYPNVQQTITTYPSCYTYDYSL